MNTHNFAKYQYKIFIVGVKIAYRFLREPTMVHRYISQIHKKLKQSRYRPGVTQRVPGS